MFLLGTGTAIGDPTETNALGKFFSLYRKDKKQDPLMIGSVKSNIGHTESAAGVAGLIKVLLMMHHGKIVPSLHVKKDKSNVNKKILLKEYNLDIAVNVSDWQTNEKGERRACINSFGFGGSNSHAVVIQLQSQKTKGMCQVNKQPLFISVSAQDEKSLVMNLEAFREEIDKGSFSLESISFTSLFHRDKLRYKTILYGTDTKDIKNQIEIRRRKASNMGKLQNNNLVFVYCGVGTTWKGMCREMMQISVFRDKIREIDKHLKPLTEWKIEHLFSSETTSYEDPFLNHVCIFATQVGLTTVWKEWNIYPDVIVGQSVGEVAAAYASGILPLSEAVRIIYHRSKILSENTGGAMMVLGNMPVEKIESICKRFRSVTVAVYSSPSACTLSGEPEELKMIKEEVMGKSEGDKHYLIRELDVKCAYHSHFVDGCMAEIEKKIGNVNNCKSVKYPIISTVSGYAASKKDYTSGRYWAENVRRPVLFYQSLEAAMKDGTNTVFLEIGPRQVLRAHVENILRSKPGLCLPSMNAQKELVSIYDTLAELYQIGYDINWETLRLRTCTPVSIPRYRFLKSKHLFIPETSKRFLEGLTVKDDQTHQYVRKASSHSSVKFELCIDLHSTPFVFDHFLSGTVLVPGATYVDVGYHVASVYFNKQISDLTLSVEFQHTLTPSNTEKTVVDVSVEEEEATAVHFTCHNNQKAYASGTVHQRKEINYMHVNLKEVIDRCNVCRDKTESYDCLRKFDFEYGKTLRLIEKSWSNEKECIVFIDVPDEVLKEFTRMKVHPSVIDTVIQTFAIVQQNSNTGIIAMPKGIKGMHINAPFQRHMYIHSHELYSTENEIHFSSFLISQDGFVVAEFPDVFARIIDNSETRLVTMYQILQSRTVLSSTETLKKGSIAALSIETDETSSCFETFVRDKTCTRISSVKSINKEITQAVILYYGKFTANSITLESAVDRFRSMKEILIEFSKQSMTCPLFLVTENTQADQTSSRSIHVSGSEYWGMIRAVRLEGLHSDIRLIDVNRDHFKIETLLQVIASKEPKHAEFVINGSSVQRIQLTESEVQPRFRSIGIDTDEPAVLCSSKPNLVSEAWYKPIKSLANNPKSSFERIRLNSIVLHEKSMYINTSNQNSKHFLLNYLEGCEVVSVESVGKSDFDEEVIVCYPVKVQTPFVFVPKSCIIPKNRLPGYEHGMILLLVTIYKLATAVCHGSNVAVVSRKNESSATLEILKYLLRKRNCNVNIICLEDYDDLKTVPKLDSIIFLCPTTAMSLEAMLSDLNFLRRIVSLDAWMSESVCLSLKLRFHLLNIISIDAAEIFEPKSLPETIPRVLEVISTSPYLKVEHKKAVLMWEYPMEFMNVSADCNTPNVYMRVGKEALFRKNGCYLVVGGLTGLGWILLQFLAEKGAGYLAVLSRRVPSKDQTNEIENMKVKYGCNIYTEQVDITDIHDLRAVICNLQNCIGRMPIRGIFQGAGVLSDAFLVGQSNETVRKVFLPKIQGSWNLHVCSAKLPLDYFVMHSSITSVVGNEGQSNYAAGNSFMDSLAAYRRSLGLPGQSLNWGPLSVGMARDNNELEKHFEASGFQTLSENEIKSCFIDVLFGNNTQYVIGKFRWEVIAEKTNQKSKYEHLLKGRLHILGSANDSQSQAVLDWFSLSNDERKTKIKELVRNTVCQEFLVSENDLQDDTTFSSLGVDSMAALSFINNFYSTTKIRIPMVRMLSDNTSVESIVQFCVDNLPEERQNTAALSFSSETVLNESIPYMQLNVLRKYDKDRLSSQLADVFEIELTNVFKDVQEWKTLIKQVMQLHPQLRMRYAFIGQDIKTVLDNSIDDGVPELYEIPYPDQCDKDGGLNNTDVLMFDLENQHPVKFHVAFSKDTTFIRIILHKVVADLRSISIICRTMNAVGLNMKVGTPLPLFSTVDIPVTVKAALLPRWDSAEHFWDRQARKKLQPLTLGNNLLKPNKEYYKTVKEQIKENMYRKIEHHLKRHGLTIFDLSVSLFQLLLHLETSQSCFATITAVDISGHVPKLKQHVFRCVNIIPLVAEFQPKSTVKDYLKANSLNLKHTLDNSFYPEDLILQKIQSVEIKENLDRHYIVMNNMESVNDMIGGENGVSLKTVSLRKLDYETKFFTRYDVKRRQLLFELGYNTEICGNDAGDRLLKRMIWMLRNLDTIEDVQIRSLNQTFENSCSETLVEIPDAHIHPVPTAASSTVLLKGEFSAEPTHLEILGRKPPVLHLYGTLFCYFLLLKV